MTTTTDKDYDTIMNKTECLTVLNQLQRDEAEQLVEASIWAKKASKKKVPTMFEISNKEVNVYNTYADMIVEFIGMSDEEKNLLSNEVLFIVVEGVDTLNSLLELKELSIVCQSQSKKGPYSGVKLGH